MGDHRGITEKKGLDLSFGHVSNQKRGGNEGDRWKGGSEQPGRNHGGLTGRNAALMKRENRTKGRKKEIKGVHSSSQDRGLKDICGEK